MTLQGTASASGPLRRQRYHCGRPDLAERRFIAGLQERPVQPYAHHERHTCRTKATSSLASRNTSRGRRACRCLTADLQQLSDLQRQLRTWRRPLTRPEPQQGYGSLSALRLPDAAIGSGCGRDGPRNLRARNGTSIKLLASQVPVYAYEFDDRTAPSYFPKMPGFVRSPITPSTSSICSRSGMAARSEFRTRSTTSRRHLSDQLVAAWTNFAWTGNPNGQGNSPWPRYQEQAEQAGYYLSENIPVLSTSRMRNSPPRISAISGIKF